MNNRFQEMKKVVTFGVFDILHIGHMLLFRNVKNLPDRGGGIDSGSTGLSLYSEVQA